MFGIAIFFLTAVLGFYVLIGYPALLALMSRLRSKPVARSVASSKIMQMNIPPTIFNVFFISTSYRWQEREFHPKSATNGKFLFQIVRLFLQIY